MLAPIVVLILGLAPRVCVQYLFAFVMHATPMMVGSLMTVMFAQEYLTNKAPHYSTVYGKGIMTETG